MKFGWTLGAVLVASSLAAGQDAQATKLRTCDSQTGPITFMEKDSRRLGMKSSSDGRIKTFTVDAVAMPHWFDDFKVGQRITVTCKDAGEERRPIATAIKTTPEESR